MLTRTPQPQARRTAGPLSRLAPTIAVGLLFAQCVFGDTWTGRGADGLWSNSRNWWESSPSANGTANIFLYGRGQQQPVVDAPWSVRSLWFGPLAGPFVMSGDLLTLGRGGIVDLSSANQNIHNNLLLSADQTWRTTSGTLSVFGSVDNGGHRLTLNTYGNSRITLEGSLGASGGLTKSGSGVLVLNGDNSFTGTLTLLKGTIEFADDAAVGAGNLVIKGGTLKTPETSATFADGLRFDGKVTVNSLGGMTLDGSLTLLADRTITVDRGELNLTRVIGRGAPLVKDGNGRLDLQGENSFSGPTIVNGGTLVAAAAGSLGQTASVTINSGAVLDLGGPGNWGRIADAATMTLNGGRIMGNNATESFGLLSITRNSVIDLVSDDINGTLTFSDLRLNGRMLTINDWTPNGDQIIFQTLSDPTALSGLYFSGFGLGGMQLPSGQIVPVPEPGFGVLLAIGGMALAVYRRWFKDGTISIRSSCSRTPARQPRG